MTDFTLPELGENITAGDVLRVLVKPGDTLAKDQPVLELETDKATIEVPSSVAGQVKDVKVKAGDKVKVGQAILSVDETARRPAAGRAEAGRAQRRQPRRPRAARRAPQSRAEDAARSPREAAAPKARAPDEPPAETRSRGAGADKVVDISRGARATAEPAAPELPSAPAAPSVRRMARELGVDIDQVAGSGPAAASRSRTSRRTPSGWSPAARRRRRRRARPPSRCPISRAGAKSSGSRCARCAARPPSI